MLAKTLVRPSDASVRFSRHILLSQHLMNGLSDEYSLSQATDGLEVKGRAVEVGRLLICRAVRTRRSGLGATLRRVSLTSSHIRSSRRSTGLCSTPSRSFHRTSRTYRRSKTFSILTLSSPANQYNSLQMTCTYQLYLIIQTYTDDLFRSTPASRPNSISGSQMSVRPSTKSFFDFNEIWYVGRGRRLMHDGMQYDPLRGQGHEPLKVGNSTIFKVSSPIYNGGWQ